MVTTRVGGLPAGAQFMAGGKTWTVSAVQEILGEVHATTLDGCGADPVGVESGCYFRADEEVAPVGGDAITLRVQFGGEVVHLRLTDAQARLLFRAVGCVRLGDRLYVSVVDPVSIGASVVMGTVAGVQA